MRIEPDPSPGEAEAIRRALEALGLVEPGDGAEVSQDGDGSRTAPDRGLSP